MILGLILVVYRPILYSKWMSMVSFYRMDDSELFDEVGTTVVVLSQMSLAFLGTFLNSILLVTLKDLPDICASTYHVLLANLCFSTVFTCTVLKPVAGIFIGYAYATRQYTINLSFCQVYTFLTGSLQPILPWSLFVLSWFLFLQGHRNKTSLGNDTAIEAVSSRSLSKIGLRKFMKFQKKKTGEGKAYMEISVTSKTSRMESGLHPGQVIILLVMWTGAVLLGIESFETQIGRGAEERELFVKMDEDSKEYTRYT